MKKSILVLFFPLLIFSACAVKQAAKPLEVSIFPTPPNSKIQNEAATVKQTDNANGNSSTYRIKTSVLSDKIEKKRAENPQISAAELADFGNQLIPEYGVIFWVDLADLIEKKTKAGEIKELADGNVSFAFSLNLVDSTRKTFEIESPTDSCCCGYAYADFPVSNITASQMTIIVDGKPYRTIRSKDVSFSQEHILIDNKTRTKKIRSWQAPTEGAPDGISEDGTKLYFEEDDSLFLEIAENGDLRFVPKNSPQIITDGKDLREFPEVKIGEPIYKSGESGFMKFTSGKKSFIVNYQYVCS